MRKLIGVMLVVCLMCGVLTACGGGASNSTGPAGASGSRPTESTQTQGSSEDYFVWLTDTIISSLSEEGKKQTSLAVPAKCERVDVITSDVLEYVVFENPDTQVSAYAFAYCAALKNIELPANLQEIQMGTFDECSALESVVIPDSVTVIDITAFDGCTNLKSVTLGQGLTAIGDEAFSDCTALENIVIPDSVVTIGRLAFSKCTALNGITFGCGVETIGESAFEGCNSLVSVVLPESLKTLEGYAFAFCEGLDEIYLPAGLESMELTSLAQNHNFAVYLTEGSYCDQKLDELMSREHMEKIYQ